MSPSDSAATDTVRPGTGFLSALDFPVVGIGASAGGLAAIGTVLENLPSNCGMALVVVMHLSPRHESNASDILQASTRMVVQQVQGEVAIQANHVYVIPPTQDLAMVDGSLRISDAVRPRGRHVVIDTFFRSLAQAHADRAIGVVLSGTGADGSAGIAWLKQNGGVVIAQSPEDAEHDGMPMNAIATGNVDMVLPAVEIAQRLTDLWRNAQQIEMPDRDHSGLRAKAPHGTEATEAAEEALRDVMTALRVRTGHEFKHYKRATLLRRIERRLQIVQLKTLPEYRDYLAPHPDEAHALLADLLIGVTQFFRDRRAFEALERDILPSILSALHDDDQLRAWVPACSTGEEVYSLGMLLTEEVARSNRPRKLTLFATDIDARAIATARDGRYPEASVADVPPARLRSFFTKEGGAWRIAKAQRDAVVFALHNVLRDPPFSRLDLISCRNLLIYLDRTAQQEVLQMFHFALKPGGVLFLGSSETVDATTSLFTPVDKTHRIYRANPGGRSLHGLPQFSRSELVPVVPPPVALPVPRAIRLADLHRSLLDDYGPLSLLVTAGHEIIHSVGRSGDYLRFAEGTPSTDVLLAARPELRSALQVCLYRALHKQDRADAEPVGMLRDGKNVVVRISARSIQNSLWPSELLLVTFNEAEDAALRPDAADAEGKDPALLHLEHELLRRSEQLQLTVEQYETSSEELKASNEELQAINEELRSASEELETSKEELQSTNEELTTVNHELKVKVEETGEINDDLANLIAVTAVATIFIDGEMRIKRFTPAATSLFNIIASDAGRLLFDLTHRLDYPDLADHAREVFASLRVIEREARAVDGRWHLARLLPYRTAQDRIGGVVLTFIDITSRREAERAALLGREQMKLIADTMTDFAILTTDPDGRFTSWSSGAERVFGWSAEEVIGLPIEILFTPEDRAAGMPAHEMRQARETGRAPDERWHLRKDGSLFYASGVMTALRENGLLGFAKICRDLTHERKADAMRESQLTTAELGVASARADSAMKGEFLAVMSHELKHPLNLINVNAQLLMTMPEAQSIEPVMRAARTIQRTVQSQARIIDDLLDLSRTSAGKLTLDVAPLLLADAIQPCLTWAAAESRHKGIRFSVAGLDEPLVINGDPIRIEQIAWNLLSNAVKFSRTGGAIAVTLGTDGADALLEVQDGGRGIPREFLPHVFDMFRQAEAPSSRQQGGLGIGLALVKSLVELHQGRVEALSEGAGRGSTFRVRLPLQERQGYSPLESAAPAFGTLAGVRILLVDDTLETLMMFADLLRVDGAAVTAVASGAEALQAAGSSAFDLIVSDIAMPGMDGYELIAELRARPATASVPAIALTGFGRPQDVTRALAAGFTRHLDKPVDFKLMRETFAELLNKARGR